MTCVLFRSILLNLQILRYLSSIFLILMYSTKVWEWLCMISVPLNLLGCGLWPRGWSVFINVPCKHEKYIFWCFGVEYFRNANKIKLIDNAVQVNYILIDFLSVWFISYWESCGKASDYFSGFCPLLLEYKFSPHVFWCSVFHSYILMFCY